MTIVTKHTDTCHHNKIVKMSENKFDSHSICTLKCFIHLPDPTTGTYGKPDPLIDGRWADLIVFEGDDRSIGEICKSVVPDLMRAFVPFYNYPENVPRCLEYYGDEKNFKSAFKSQFYIFIKVYIDKISFLSFKNYKAKLYF